MNPVLKYRGGKSREIQNFLKFIPRKYNYYIEPFFGGGALYFYLEPKKAIVNDINERLMTFYIQLRNNYPEMRKQLDKLQCIYEKNQAQYEKLKLKKPNEYIVNENESLYYLMRDLFNHSDGSYMEGVLYYFINKTSYSGMIRYNNKGEYNVPYGRYKNFNTKLITKDHSHLLQSAQLYSKDYSEIFNLAKSDDFIFLDPPYDCTFNDYGNLNEVNGFDEKEHRRLAADFRNLPCPSLMIIGKTPLTQELYQNYIVDEYHKNYAVNIKNRFNNNKIHLIVKNYT